MNKTRIVVLLDAQGCATILSDSPDVQVLVLDADTEGTDTVFQAGGQTVALDGLLGGLPKVDAEQVGQLYEEVTPQLVALAGNGNVPQRDRVQLSYLAQALRRPATV